MVLEVPPNIWLEIHSNLMVSNSMERKGRNMKKKEEQQQSICDSRLQMTRDQCLCESSQCYLRPHYSSRLYYRAEPSELMRSKQLLLYV